MDSNILRKKIPSSSLGFFGAIHRALHNYIVTEIEDNTEHSQANILPPSMEKIRFIVSIDISFIF